MRDLPAVAVVRLYPDAAMAVPPHRVAPAPVTGAPVTHACREAVDELATRHERCAVFLLLDGRLRCVAASGLFQVLDGFLPPEGVVGRSVAGGRAVVDGEPAQVSAPLVVNGTSVGAVTVQFDGTHPPVEEVEAAATALAEALSDLGGFSSAPLGQQLAHLALDVASAPDAERLRRVVIEGATRLTGTSSAAIVHRSAAGEWTVGAATGPLAQAIWEWDGEQLAVLGRDLRAGVAAHVRGTAPVPSAYTFLRRADVTSLGAYPLVVAGELVGLLLVADTEERPFDPMASAAAEVLAALAGSSLRAAGLLSDVAERGRGALEGLPAAGVFRDDLTDMCIEAIRSGEVTHTCLLLAPGDPGSDDALGTLVEALLGQLRHGDSLYRLAEQEFAILLATGSADSATAVTGRLDRAAHAAGVPVALGWALVDGPPAAVTAAARASLGPAPS